MITVLIVLAGLVACVFALRYLNKKIAKGKEFLTQIEFIQMYCKDTTEKEFYNKEPEEAVELGQDMLWRAGTEFHLLMQKALIDRKPLDVGDMRILQSVIRIVKTAETMVFIEKNGPMYHDNNEDNVNLN